MSERASAIILSKRHLLLIHRVRPGREFYVFPGGQIEEGETPAEACIREVQEETGLQTVWLSEAFEHPLPNRNAHYFFVQVQPGAMTLGGPESQRQSAENRYLLEWVPLRQVGGINLQPAQVRNALARVCAEFGPIREAPDLAAHRARLIEMLNEDVAQ